MAKNVDREFLSLLGDFSVPDKDHLEWAPAETVFVSVLADEPTAEFFPVAVASEAESTVIEFEIADIQASELIADFDVPGGSDIDLSILLSSYAPELDSHQSNLLSVLDDVINDPQPAETSSPSIQTAGLEFSGLTVVIDDDGIDTVAI